MNNDLVADVLYDLGKSYYQKKYTDKALLCYREALRIWKILANNKRAFEASLAIVSLSLLLWKYIMRQRKREHNLFCLG